MENLDTRVQFTRSALKNALLKILRKKPIGKVTVKELCEAAGLNRSTFYLHYGEPNDVLKEIEDDAMSKQLPLFSNYASEDNDLAILSSLFSAMLQNKDLYLILVGRNGSPQFTERIKKKMWPQLKTIWQKEFPEYNPKDLELVYDFIFAGSIQLFLQWMQDGSELTTDQIARRLDRLGHYCHLAIREF